MTAPRTVKAQVRLSPAEAQRLDELAQRSHRTRSDVVRILLSKATVHDLPETDIAIEPAPPAEEQHPSR